MAVQVAFLIGDRLNIADLLIRWRTQSQASHCEIVIDGSMYSSYPGTGVRKALFVNSPQKWFLLDLPEVDPKPILAFFEKTKGMKYDWLAVILGQSFYMDLENSHRYFCSEWCAEALGFPQAWRFTPALLEVVLQNTDLKLD
jgi:hypothetical protein